MNCSYIWLGGNKKAPSRCSTHGRQLAAFVHGGCAPLDCSKVFDPRTPRPIPENRRFQRNPHSWAWTFIKWCAFIVLMLSKFLKEHHPILSVLSYYFFIRFQRPKSEVNHWRISSRTRPPVGVPPSKRIRWPWPAAMPPWHLVSGCFWRFLHSGKPTKSYWKWPWK